MKRRLTLLGLSLMFSAVMAFAQRSMDDENERRVRIVRGPEIVNVTDNSATINWTTNSSGANQVRYRMAGSNDPWQSAYHQGGGTNHSFNSPGFSPAGRTTGKSLRVTAICAPQGNFKRRAATIAVATGIVIEIVITMETATEGMTREIMAIESPCIAPAIARAICIYTPRTPVIRMAVATIQRHRRLYPDIAESGYRAASGCAAPTVTAAVLGPG